MEIVARLVDITTLSVDAIVNAANTERREGLESIAFPAISTGIYGYPLEPATRVAVTTVRGELAAAGILTQVIFACFTPDVLKAYTAEGIAL